MVIRYTQKSEIHNQWVNKSKTKPNQWQLIEIVEIKSMYSDREEKWAKRLGTGEKLGRRQNRKTKNKLSIDYRWNARDNEQKCNTEVCRGRKRRRWRGAYSARLKSKRGKERTNELLWVHNTDQFCRAKWTRRDEHIWNSMQKNLFENDSLPCGSLIFLYFSPYRMDNNALVAHVLNILFTIT